MTVFVIVDGQPTADDYYDTGYDQLVSTVAGLRAGLSRALDEIAKLKGEISNHRCNKKLSYCWETVRRESMQRMAEMDVKMTTLAEMTFKYTSRSSKVAPIES